MTEFARACDSFSLSCFEPRSSVCPWTSIFVISGCSFSTCETDEVSQVLKEHPEITKIEVQGHTDDRGSKQLNEKLSQARANSVMAALVKRGIEQERLSAKGYGPNVPI